MVLTTYCYFLYGAGSNIHNRLYSSRISSRWVMLRFISLSVFMLLMYCCNWWVFGGMCMQVKTHYHLWKTTHFPWVGCKVRNRIVCNRIIYKDTHAHFLSRTHTHTETQWDILWRLWVSEHLLVVRLFPSSWREPLVTQGDLSTGSQSEQQCQNPPKAVRRRCNLY